MTPHPESIPLAPTAPMSDRTLDWRRPSTWAERGWIPDRLLRLAIRSKLRARLEQEAKSGTGVSLEAFVKELDGSPIAVATERANEQHYELPSKYFDWVLGPRRKYSSTYWPDGVDDLGASEEAMLELTAERADLQDGQRILELGCGWGSFSLWAAERFPHSEVVGVSNSRTQRAHLEAVAESRGLRNLSIRTSDMNEFEAEGAFDRIVSIEMFEHMKNYRALMRKISTWLVPSGKLFVHIFTHRRYAYHFLDTGSEDDWMAHYFFAGGTMPSDDLLLHFQDDLSIEGHWRLNGEHYSRTLEAWLKRHDELKAVIIPLFEKTYGDSASARRWYQRWRLFYLSCSELFRFRGGEEWMVSHYRFARHQKLTQ